MRKPFVLIVAVAIAVVVMFIAFAVLFPRLAERESEPDAAAPSAEDIELNNLGVGRMGRYEYEQARLVFQDLADRHPDWLDVRINLAVAFLNRQMEGDEERALAILEEILREDAANLRADYTAGLLKLYLGRPEDALEHFQRVAAADPDDAHAAYFVGHTLAQRREHEQALHWYERAIRRDPYLRSAYYGAAQSLMRLDRDDQAEENLTMFQRLAENPRARLVDFVYTRMGPKAEAAALGLPEPKPAERPEGPLFEAPAPLPITNNPSVGAAPQWINPLQEPDGNPIQPIHIVDIDGDGRLDLFIPNILRGPGAARNAVLVGEGDGEFRIDLEHPLAAVPGVRAAAWGDIDNSGRVDVYLIRNESNQLWMQADDGVWRDVTAEVRLIQPDMFTSSDAIMVDADHDGDLDIFLANIDGPNELYINNLDGTFRPIAAERGIAGEAAAGSRQVFAADLERDRDLDLAVINTQPPHEVHLNELLWEYRPAPEFDEFRDTPIAAVVAGDVAVNGRAELYALHREDGAIHRWTADDAGGWRSQRITEAHPDIDGRGPVRLALIDLTGNGTKELLASGGDRLVIFRLGEREGEALATTELGIPNAWTHANLDPQRGPWLITLDESGRPVIHEPGTGRHNFALLSFTGREDAGQQMRSNASGIGTYYAARIGSRWTAGMYLREHSGPGQDLQPVAIGLGGAARIDFVHLDWSDGVFQSEIELAAGEHHIIEEEERQLASCPILFAWDGERYEFVSDILGVGGIGFAVGPGVYAPSRPWERFLLPEGLLQPKETSKRRNVKTSKGADSEEPTSDIRRPKGSPIAIGERLEGPTAPALRYVLKIGEPMEETLYLDAAHLVMYELPPGWSMTIDERFAANDPQPTGQSIFYRESMLPERAVNDRGQDVTDDVRYVDGRAAPVGQRDRRFLGRLLNDNVIELTFPEPITRSAERTRVGGDKSTSQQVIRSTGRQVNVDLPSAGGPGSPFAEQREWGPHQSQSIATGGVPKRDALRLGSPDPVSAASGGFRGEDSLSREQLGSSPVLIADGWIEYPYSQTMFAAWQAGADYRAATIEAQDEHGRWHTVLHQFGYPAGMPRQMAVPLPVERIPPGSRALRISTNQEVYWDRIRIAWGEECEDCQRTELPLVSADVRRVGFAQRTVLPQRRPFYDYDNRPPLWDARHHIGHHTRFGPVEQLIRERNDALAIIGPGEEVHMEFDAAPVGSAPPGAVPPALRSPSREGAGWTRRFVLEVHGWCKDMDLYTLEPDTIEPLPAWGGDAERRRTLHEKYNTRFEAGH